MSWDSLHLAATDRQSGSAVVAQHAARAMTEIAVMLSRDAIVDATRTLVQGQPLMASCVRLADVVLRGLDEDGPPGAHRAARGFVAKLETEKNALGSALCAKLPREGAVLTVSASSTVLGALLARPHLRVVCAVSEPGGEGRTAVDVLRRGGVDANVIPDGAIAQQSTRVDAIVIGADVIGPSAILNKSGTLAAALGARAAGRPCICAAGTSKLVDEAAWTRLASAADRLAVEGVRVFEEVPAALITSFVTEDGVTTSRSLRKATRTHRLHPLIADWLAG
jgi:translation initiation factor 2B subunit (eIF-2B alpha/beta/delta family)